MKMIKKKWMKITLLIAVVLGVLSFVGVLYYRNVMDPYRETVMQLKQTLLPEEALSREEALEDLEYLKEHLQDYHPAYLDGSDHLITAVRKQYEAEITALDDIVTVLDLWRAASRIVSPLHDGHTGVYFKNPETERYISDLTQTYEYGYPIKIDGIETVSLFETFKSHFSYEMEAYAKDRFYHNCLFQELYLGLCQIDTKDGVTFTYETGEGLSDYHYDFVPYEDVITPEGKEKNEVNSDEWVSYVIDTDHNLAVFTLKECAYNEKYSSVLDSFFKEVRENDISNIAVDLRGNGGGNSWVANAFLEYVDVDSYQSWNCDVRFGWYLHKNTDVMYQNKKKDTVFSGNLFVLTDICSFSAAMDFAMLVGDNDIGYIVGEASGNKPASYGDVLPFQMPNSGLGVGISFKKWYRIDKEKAEEPLTPDYEVEADKALDKVYELIKDGTF